MNFKKYSDNLLYSSFNHTNDCVVFGTLNGFYVYTVSPFKKIISRKIMGGVSIVKMLYKSNIFGYYTYFKILAGVAFVLLISDAFFQKNLFI